MRPHGGFLTAVPAALVLFGAWPVSAQRSAEPKIDSLLARMTLEEKLGQLNQLSVDNQPSAEQLEMVRKGLVGSLFNLTGAAATHAAQLVAVTDSRLHIPLIFGQDVIHGYRTIFPIPLGETASWDPEAVEAAAHVAAREAAAAGVHWTFAPPTRCLPPSNTLQLTAAPRAAGTTTPSICPSVLYAKCTCRPTAPPWT